MNRELLNPDIQRFVNDHIGSDVVKLALSKNPFPGTDWIAVIAQISAKTKAKDKLPTWFNTKNILYPSKVSVEQTSSEITAQYKSRLVSGKTLIDLSGGFGVDDFYFSKRFECVAHCEINPELSEIVAHNFKVFGAENINCIVGDSIEILKKSNCIWDWIYIDPSRRSDAKGKVFLLADCLPNVPENLESYFSFSDRILIKTAPLLDISAGLSELSQVKSIHIVSVRSEVKELLWELEKGFSGEIRIEAVDFSKDGEMVFGFFAGRQETATYALPGKYLYEPNAAIMKSGGFEQIGAAYGIPKLHRHSHLYTSDEFVPDFPGRVFKINQTVPYGKTTMKPLEKTQANITVRNFPDTVETIRKKWKIADGGQTFCFFTTDLNNDKIVLICTKI